ncbi:MAG: PAS domain-containing sensor histidine kinase [Planctomycetes bacterium]|nr:PAS domain-containing sensor histidine kinase [Planctomycetota bacterium]
MIWRSRGDGRRDYFNAGWSAFTGLTPQETAGDGWRRSVHPDDLAPYMAVIQDVDAHPQPFQTEYRLRRHDGVYRTVIERAAPFTDDSGAFAGFVGSSVDIHDVRQAEAEKSNFAARIAHELRTPLTSAMAYVEAIRRRAGRRQEIGDDLFERLHRQIERFSSLVQDLGEVTQAGEARRLPLRVAPVDLTEVVREGVGFFTYGLATDVQGLHTISIEAPEERLLVRGDRRRLDQVVANLLDNAVKFSPKGGPIRIILQPGPTAHTLSISDTGIGVPREEIPLLARPYYRASNVPGASISGLGLGLSVTKGIVEAHGGALTIASELGKGTTVAVQLPKAAAP